MGWRAIRIGLDRPAMLRQQLRALLRAARGRDLRVMFPMIAEVAEFDAARAVLDLEIDRAPQRRRTSCRAQIEVGVMLEVPALLWQLPALLPNGSISCRSAPTIWCSSCSPATAAIRVSPSATTRCRRRCCALLGEVVARLRRAPACRSALCGEMAGSPLEAMALVGLGFRTLSMAPAAIGPVKAMIRSLDARARSSSCSARYPALPTRSLRGKLRDFARDHGVVV